MTLHDRFLAARCRFRSSNIEDLSKGALDYCNTFVDLFAEKEILEDEI